ncbi:acyl-acyl carrier protein thioesterase ATL3, chloroplastic [Brachypodium distachyon]|uniref:Thioesterase domain-containing protein n=1 Tax=Brachypodium distachyon TaxID=15368 RepID=I1J0E1_BRADI|nr:acyl-acyl carrier protein thioesterase ATL3, chloroplastic [Brachypodium distachyon]KQJ83958.1 hypothetical protein BRADI_5g17830v3 [Brachypodium distachyon]|eukprot:XP_003580291.1 acyl-acyl carrier protein thioesterase ATL3, chloroplastic [Brachypodium distachyon]
MQQIGAPVPLANHQFLQHPCRICTAGAGRSNSGHLLMSLHKAYLHRHQFRVAPRTSSTLQAVTTSTVDQNSNIRKDKYFKVEMEVHETELDQYGVVNNVIYTSYIQNGRDKLLESLGISVDSIISKGDALALSELRLKYFAPLKNGDRFVVKTKLMEIKGVRIIFEHIIETLADHKLVLEAKGTAVCLNKDYRPTRVFPDMSTKLLQYFSSDD